MRLLFMCFLASGAVFAQDTATGSVSGRVLDADTGAPLPGVAVAQVRPRGGRTTTDSQGRYTLLGVSPGVVGIGVPSEDMVSNDSRHVTVIAGREAPGIDLQERLAGEISGRVLDENGEPLPGIRVSAIRREYSRAGAYSGRTEYSNGELWYSVQGSATTDDRGRYVIDRVHAGEASWILAQAAPRDANWAMSDAPADPRARKQTLVPTYYPKSLSREGAVPVVVHSLEHRENVDVRMARAPSYCLEATLTAGGTPAKMRFGIEDAGTYPVLQSYNALWPQTPGVSGDDGRIRVCDLNPGRFQLTAARSVAPSRNPDYSGSTPVTISDGDVLGVKVATFPPVTIHASVVWDGSPPNGSASPSFSVGLWPTPLGPSRATTSIPGEFSPEAAPVTHYSFLIYDLAPPLYIKDITYGDASILHKSFVPGSVGGSGALRVVIGRNGGSLNAKVADDDGHPVADCWVVALPASAQTEAEAATSVVVGQTDVAGSFAFAGLPPGNYSVFATTYALPAKFTTANPPVPTLTKTPEILNKFLQARPRGKEVDIGPGGAVQVMLTPKSLD